MNSSLLAKIAGWMQFGLTVLFQILHGGATTPIGLASIGTAAVTGIAIHHAASTDGAK